MLYYAQGYYLAKYNQVLFEEPIEAWPYGPVISAVYAETLCQEIQWGFQGGNKRIKKAI
ncbi:MAG: Panacea domain-containing protein [Vigna little leaf phytoplasma]|nr:Panacea domain-containing protein [Vigna little leaf phytoplasma]